MTHIANCIRQDADTNNVYITPAVSTRFVTAAKDSIESISPLERSHTILGPVSPTATSRYQLWPTPSTRSVAMISERLTALSMGRSSSSLSDTAVSADHIPSWRSGSLARRRKVSVPELGGTTMTTVQEVAIDSPTIPGHPPLRKASVEAFGHERSSSAPGVGWRTGPFGGALVSCVTGPSYLLAEQNVYTASSDVFVVQKAELLGPIGRPLSPILSPSMKPSLKVDTGRRLEGVEVPPPVPSKSPASIERKGSPTLPTLRSKSSRQQIFTPASTTSGGNTPLSALESRRSPNVYGSTATPLSANSNAFVAGSPMSAFDRRASPRVEKRNPISSHNRNMSDTSVMDRGRPIGRDSKRQRSRTRSETNEPEPPVQDNWKLPRGMRARDAAMRMNDADKGQLHKQAYDQADKFEVLHKRDVASLSRELRALDERCDYLRKHYKSLRAGRQKLHSRMISYLKRGETVIFSRESLLKQEEALSELDSAIDEFIAKLEQAENRRLRLRQKLLEHVAAALILNPPASRAELAESTPPRSPVKAASPLQLERNEVESIKIYADSHVLNLFSDIEQAIGKMCDPAY